MCLDCSKYAEGGVSEWKWADFTPWALSIKGFKHWTVEEVRHRILAMQV